MNNYTFNVIQSLLYSYVQYFEVDSDKIACPCLDFNSGYAIITTWNKYGVPINRLICFDPYELDEDEEGLCYIKVEPVSVYFDSDYDTVFKFLVLFCSEKLSSIYAIGFSPYLRVFDVKNLEKGKVVFTGFCEGV